MKINLKYLVSTFLLFCLAFQLSNSVFAQKQPDGSVIEIFKNPDVDAKGMFRWWFPDAKAGEANDDGIAKHVREMYDAGFGGVEVAMVIDQTNMDNEQAKVYGWGTPNWVKLMKKVLKAAKALPGEFKVDFTISAHWPPSFNTIDPNDEGASTELSYAYKKITAPGVMELPMPEQKTNDNHRRIPADFIFVDRFAAATIGRVKSIDGNKIILDKESLKDLTGISSKIIDESTGQAKYTPAGIPENSTLFGNKEKLADKQYYWEVNLDPSCLGDEYQASTGEEIAAGDWIVFAYYSRGTGAVMSGGASFPMADRMYEISYFNKEGVQVIADYWRKYILNDPELVALLKWAGADIFEDSIESKSDGAFWCWDFLKEFADYRNYDLTPFLPVIATSNTRSVKFLLSDGNSTRVIEDYHTTLNDLYIDEHVRELQNWTREFNYGYRAQAYGASIETSGASTVLDVTEGESLGFGTRYDQFRNLAGGAHLAGKKFVSDEVLADMGGTYKITWKHAANTLNNNFAAGVNRMVIHGTAYKTDVSGEFDYWPGWHPFGAGFADPWGPRQASWEDIETLAGFINRTQAVLQNGLPTIDIAVYKNSLDYGYGFSELHNNGYSYDVVSTAGILYPGADVAGKVLAPEGPAYQALIVKDQISVTLDAADQLIQYAKAGLPIIVYGQVPEQVPGVSGEVVEALKLSKPTDTEVKEKVEKLLSFSNVVKVANEQEVVPALQKLGVTPYASYSNDGLLSLARRDADGTFYYYMFNSGEKAINVPVELTGEGKPYLLNTWSGKITPIAEFNSSENKVVTNLKLEAEESFVIAITKNDQVFGNAGDLYVTNTNAEGVKYSNGGIVLCAENQGSYQTTLSNGETITSEIESVGDNIELNDWNLLIESWGPGEVENDPTIPEKTKINVGKTKPVSWDELEVAATDLTNAGVDSMKHVSGIAFYTTTFNVGKEWTGGYNAILAFTHGDDMVTEITINGKTISGIDQTKDKIDIGGYLKKGANEIQIKLVTTMINRVKVANEQYDGKHSMFGPPPGEMPQGGMPGGFEAPGGMPPMGGPGIGQNSNPVYGLTKVEIIPYGQVELK